MSYRLAIFDYDGTLVDSFPWFMRIFDEVADHFGFRRLDRDRLDSLRGLGARELVRAFDVPAWKLPLIATHVRKLAKRDRDDIRLFDGVADMLHALAAQGTAIAVVTSNSEDNVRHALGPGLAALVRHYECGASLFGKGRKLRNAVKHGGRAPREALVIGDEIRDLEAARAEGLRFGAVGWGYTTLQALRAQGPDEVFAAVADIPRAFLS